MGGVECGAIWTSDFFGMLPQEIQKRKVGVNKVIQVFQVKNKMCLSKIEDEEEEETVQEF